MFFFLWEVKGMGNCSKKRGYSRNRGIWCSVEVLLEQRESRDLVMMGRREIEVCSKPGFWVNNDGRELKMVAEMPKGFEQKKNERKQFMFSIWK